MLFIEFMMIFRFIYRIRY